MHEEITSDYVYKYDLLRNYVMELIHFGQKLKPILPIENNKTASSRTTSLFIELLERQFPIENISQLLQLKTPADFAGILGVHVNHLNRVLKKLQEKPLAKLLEVEFFRKQNYCSPKHNGTFLK
jgi:hypothetical protein